MDIPQAASDNALAALPAQDPYSKTAQEKARLEAQQRLMGIDTNKKPKKKTKKKMLALSHRMSSPSWKSSSESESEQEAEKAAEPVPEKSWEEMSWAERGDQAAQKAESDAIWKGRVRRYRIGFQLPSMVVNRCD
eukprot:Skav201603  [mRNA]  locus=scaffold152:858917:863242:+ [translate_table: standard]